jgi:hypothetical protein
MLSCSKDGSEDADAEALDFVTGLGDTDFLIDLDLTVE